jgi:hypothetical protein
MNRLFVMFDTNVWVKEHMFRSSVGAAILLGLKSKGSRLFVPETLRDEVSARIADAAATAAARAKSQLATLLAIIGSAPTVRLPKAPDIDRAVLQRWSELEPVVQSFTVTEEVMRRALRRVIGHRAPGGEKEQFRDALLWEAALEYAQSADLHFVSDDKDFGSNNKLLPELRDDVTRTNARLTFHSHTDTLLPLLVPSVPISVAAVIEAVLAALGWRLAELRSAAVFDIGDVVRSEVKAYATERPDTLAVTFEIRLSAARREELVAGELIVGGECASDTQTGMVFDVRPEKIVFKTVTEESKIGTALYEHGSSSGLELKTFTVRHEIFDSRRA